MKTLLCIALLMLAGSAPCLAAMPPEEAARFRKDLDYLADELPKRHANLFHTTSRETFAAEVARLRTQLPTLDRGDAIVGLAKIVALARDGHSALFLLPFPGMKAIEGIHPMPIQLYDFPDGLRVIAIDKAHANLLGAKLVAVGDVPVEEATRRVADLVPQDNAMGVHEYVPYYLALAEVASALALSKDATGVDYVFDTGKGRQKLHLAPMAVPADSGWVTRLRTLPGPRAAWVAAGDSATTPRWLANEEQPWWFEVWPDGTVYAQINAMHETPQARFADFAEKLFAAVPKDGNSHLILDLRLNRGGNGDLIWSVIHGVIRHDAINRPDRLFVLTGRRTFSAGQMFANGLEKHTHATFVGEPTGSSPNHYGELGQLPLPETKLMVFYSQLYWQHSATDHRAWIAPRLAAPLQYADLAAGRDPAIAAIAGYRPLPKAREVMGALIEQGQTAKAIAAFRGTIAAQRNPWANLFEKDLNNYGYSLLEEKKTDAAVAVLSLAAELYPESANAWDSLGEAWLSAGVRHRAAYCYARSLRLNPDNPQGRDTLASILGE
ncbi:S41 family peptidase [Arenimonas oryziterrae]|uniref:Uncharacterized protein n=1 Tax=Arenimonas oryziterrae DSM 21050 = YC6267 TaxID=1121015 RepID=A0A091AZG8_9GAMM|nr:S41 family peptidase [Arenimonas oryziterrae]KFN44836.1 hypothetical protein N789_02130 [Arenimonas oryziterrae DSM 21050 = YC6267]